MQADRTRPAWQTINALASPGRLLQFVQLVVERIGWIAPLSVLFALAARLPYFRRSDFPLNDGGLFLAMTQDLFANRFALPAFTTYNAAHIPFTYPPLGFYLTAGVHALTGVDIFALARWLPLIENVATVLLVAFLARAVLGRGVAAGVAPIIFALLPRSYEWMIMGGGLTRALGYLLAVASVLQAIRFARTAASSADQPLFAPSAWGAASCALLAGLALGSHLEEGLFALYSVVLALACFGRDRRALAACAVVGVGSALVTAPWWVTAIAEHGFEPFRAASMTSGWSTPSGVLSALGEFLAPPSVPLAVVGALSLIGAGLCLVRGQFFVPVWLLAIFLLTPRSAPSEAVLPVALLASVALVELLLPALVKAARRRRRPAALSRLIHPVERDVRLVASASTVLLLLAGVYSVWPRLPVDPYSLDSLQPGERAAMAWVATNTAPDARFLVLSSTGSWEEDMAGEWFPVLSGRQSVLTPQGTEWLPDQLSARKICLFQKVRDVAGWQNGIEDLDAWASDRGVIFSDIYVSKAVRGQVDWSAVVASAAASPDYSVVFDTADAAVLHRSAPIAPRWPASGQFVVASDCASLADEGPQVMAQFEARYGQQAAQAWVGEHEQALPVRPSLTSLVATLARPHGG